MGERMKIGILSDTHDHLGNINRALAELKKRGCEVLIHAGDFVAPFALKVVLGFDGPVYAVLGNCDGESGGLRKMIPTLSKTPLKLELGSRRIVVVHDLRKLKDSAKRGADVIVCGHTHIAEIVPGKPLIINPGECAGWLTGRSTAAVLDTDKLEAETLDLGAWA